MDIVLVMCVICGKGTIGWGSCKFLIGECLPFLRQELVIWKKKKMLVLSEVATEMAKIL